MRTYVLSGENLTLGTGNVLAAIQTAANGLTAAGILELLRLEIFQAGTATSAQIRGEIATRNSAGTLTMSAATPRCVQPLTGPASGLSGNTAPAGGAARCGINSSADSGGTYVQEIPFGTNNLNGYLDVSVPEERVIVPAGVIVVARLLATPTTTTGWGFRWTFREVV